MLELILVRHGETAGNLRLTALGTTDLPLTERGKRQAHSLGRALALQKIDAIYTSPLVRAVDTAKAIAKSHGFLPEEMLDLCERRYGLWENTLVDELPVKFPEEHAAWQADPLDYVIPLGESLRECYDRNVRVLEMLLRRHTEGTIVLVSHAGCIRNMLAHLLGMGIASVNKFQVNTGSICRLKIDDKCHGVLTSFNEF